jgi:hypothetical protein
MRAVHQTVRAKVSYPRWYKSRRTGGTFNRYHYRLYYKPVPTVSDAASEMLCSGTSSRISQRLPV